MEIKLGKSWVDMNRIERLRLDIEVIGFSQKAL